MEPIKRYGSRALMVDADDRILLFCHVDSDDAISRLWAPPGGALEAGESYDQALMREIQEETGLTLTSPGIWVWSRSAVFLWHNKSYQSIERFYLIRVQGLGLRTDGWTALERDIIKEHRWWSVQEILSATDQVFVPYQLGRLLLPLLTDDIPATPLTVTED